MVRPRRDGLPSRTPNRQRLTDHFVNRLKPESCNFLVWDIKVSGLAVAIYPTGTKVWKVIYAFSGRTRWYTIGKADAISLDDARRLAAQVLLRVATDVDPQAERKAARSAGTFEELARRYVDEHAKLKNKSWAQAAALVRRNLLPRWGKLPAASITRADVKAAHAKIESPTTANQTLAAASAIFNWAIKEEVGGVRVNPCQRVDRNATQSRERVLSDSEIQKFWAAFDDHGLIASTALKLILLAGQRPGEVRHMRREHVKDGWWEMPGRPRKCPSLLGFLLLSAYNQE